MIPFRDCCFNCTGHFGKIARSASKALTEANAASCSWTVCHREVLWQCCMSTSASQLHCFCLNGCMSTKPQKKFVQLSLAARVHKRAESSVETNVSGSHIMTHEAVPADAVSLELWFNFPKDKHGLDIECAIRFYIVHRASAHITRTVCVFQHSMGPLENGYEVSTGCCQRSLPMGALTPGCSRKHAPIIAGGSVLTWLPIGAH